MEDIGGVLTPPDVVGKRRRCTSPGRGDGRIGVGVEGRDHKRSALRGVTSGWVELGRKDVSEIPVWLILDSDNVDWGLAVLTDGRCTIDCVIFRDRASSHQRSAFMSCVAALDLPVLQWPRAASTANGLPVARPGTIALTNLRCNPTMMTFLTSHGVDWVLSTTGIRRVPTPWRRAMVLGLHADMGGVTDGVTKVCIAFRGDSVDLSRFKLEHAVLRDVGTVLAFGEDCSRRLKVSDAPVNPLRCLNVGTPSDPIYHGRGLLPARPTLSVKVATGYPRTRKGYLGVRCLTPKELLQSLDIGDRHLSHMLPCASNMGSFAPLHVLCGALKAVRSLRDSPRVPLGPSDGVVTGGDSFKRSADCLGSDAPSSSANRVKLSNCPDDVTVTTVDTEDDATLVFDDCTVYESSDTICVSSLIEGPVTVEAGVAEGMTSPEAIEMFASIDGVSEASPETTEDPSEGVSREAREKKATKNDKAPVPTYLWKEHLVNDGPTPWTTKQQIGLDAAMDLMSRSCFRWWQNNLRKDFMRWLRKKHRNRMIRAAQASKECTEVVWNPVKQCYEWSSASGLAVKPKIWNPESESYEFSQQEGKAVYQRWHSRFYGKDTTLDFDRDIKAGRDAIYRGLWSNWWDWKCGSRPFFWRWPPEAMELARDGMLVYFIQAPPEYLVPQAKDRDPASKRLTEEKLQKVIDRGYLDNEDIVVSLTSFFHVPKGDDDIRMVYDGTKCGLNDAVWVPTFFMPTIETHLRAVEEGTYMCDVDVGEMFLNFMMHPDLRQYCGVDLSPYDLDLNDLSNPVDKRQRKKWVNWNRCAMGLTWSPYQAVKSMHFAEEVIRGDRTDPDNVFRWDRVRMNLPGQTDHDPSRPWVSKVKDTVEGITQVAADLFTFVDDLRPTGADRAEAWKAGRRSASLLNWLGIQDAPRKRRDSRQDPGAWAGCVLRTEDGVHALVSDEKWAKMRSQLEELALLVDTAPEELPRKRLEQIRGFMNYVCQTYRYLIPYLNGLHMTIDGWRLGRDSEGYRLPVGKVEDLKAAAKLEEDYDPNPTPPETVRAMDRLKTDLLALTELCGEVKPPPRRVRARASAAVYYGFGDASGSAFGASLQHARSSFIHYEFGQWKASVTAEESSNWREFTNLVEYLEGRAREGILDGAEVFMFTDNSTAEGAFWRGTSHSRKLCDLVLRLRKLERDTGMILHVVHISGKRMIKSGIDGLSRSDHTTGVMAGEDSKDFIPLHEDALSRSLELKTWLEDVLEETEPKFLSPDDWFDTTVNQEGTFVWTPAPAAAEVVVERLGIARHKRPNSLHLVVAPRLMTGRWRKHLAKSCPTSRGGLTWSRDFEGFCKDPSCGTYLARLKGIFCANYSSRRGSFLPCKGCWCAEHYCTPTAVEFPIRESLDEDGVPLYREDGDTKFKQARDGDQFVVPFQCDLCHFRNLQGRNPVSGLVEDDLLLAFIRRANLDAFGSREASTVKANLSGMKRLAKTEGKFGLRGIIPPMGPFPLRDEFGMAAAVAVLDRSLDPGRYEQHVQWATFRKTRSTITNASQSGVTGLGDVIGAYERNRTWVSSVPTHSFWFHRFMIGVHRRVGDEVRKDEPLTADIVLAAQNILERMWERTHAANGSRDELLRIAMIGAWMIGGFCTGVRGEEKLWFEMAGTVRSLVYLINPGSNLPPHFEFFLSGPTKDNRLAGVKMQIPCVSVTASGIKPGLWVQRQCRLMQELGLSGRLFQKNLAQPKLSEFEDDYFSLLETVQAHHPQLIKPETVVRDDFGLERSERRGATNHAINQGLPRDLINLVNRWRVEFNTTAPHLDMIDQYSRIDQLKPTLLRYSEAF